jgi:hypothetical protein
VVTLGNWIGNWYVESDWTTVLGYQRLSNSCMVDVTDYTEARQGKMSRRSWWYYRRDSRMLKEGTEEVRKGYKDTSTNRKSSKEWRHKTKTENRYKKKELVVVEGKPEDEQTSVMTGTLRIK